MPSRWSRTYARHGCSSSRRRPANGAPGFTLVEVVVAIGILSMVIISVFMLVTVSAASLKDSDMRNTATNIANYTVEYLRARNVTYPDNPLGHAVGEFGNDTAHSFPGLIDLGGDAVNNKPVGSIVSATALSINNSPDTLYSSLQGYVSLADYPTNAALSSEDGNAKVLNGKYCDATPRDLARTPDVPYVLRFPLNTGSGAIKNFTALTGYNGYIYTAAAGTGTFASDPHYTTDQIKKAGARAYTGFRVLSQIVARSSGAHVQYYDVQVTVFWILGSAEHSYSVATEIATY